MRESILNNDDGSFDGLIAIVAELAPRCLVKLLHLTLDDLHVDWRVLSYDYLALGV